MSEHGSRSDDAGDGGDDAKAEAPTTAVVLDLLPNGRPDDDRPAYQKSPVAYALGEAEFGLYELTLEDDSGIGIGDTVAVDPPGEHVQSVRSVDFEGLTGAARSELEYAVNDIIDRNERRFVDFYNDAQAITTRLHALNLLPGIGKKLRNNVLDERKRGPFESFEELKERVSGLHRPREVLVERIMEELREEDLKYRIFARQSKGS
jgi:putative nucleotide binding protein